VIASSRKANRLFPLQHQTEGHHNGYVEKLLGYAIQTALDIGCSAVLVGEVLVVVK